MMSDTFSRWSAGSRSFAVSNENRGSGLGRAVFHGKRGELRQRYREGQEDRLGALGLVLNVIVLWNTICIDAALTQLRAEGYSVREGGLTLDFLALSH